METVIIPNSKLITENVVNWTHNERKVGFRIPVTVAFHMDVRKVEHALLEAARGPQHWSSVGQVHK